MPMRLLLPGIASLMLAGCGGDCENEKAARVFKKEAAVGGVVIEYSR